MDNEFFNAPLLVNREANHVDAKQELIKGLELKNSKLKKEIINIQKIMDEKFNQIEKEEEVKKRESIFLTEENIDVLTKELDNVYKQIKLYENEIKKLKNNDNSVNPSQRAVQIDQVIKEKKALSEKLKQQYLKQQRLVQENTKKLDSYNLKDENELIIKKLSDEAKFYREKVKFHEEKEQTKTSNLKKQYEAIKKIESELIKGGMSNEMFDELKQRSVIGGNYKNDSNLQSKEDEEEIDDRTRQNYQNIMNEMGILKRMLQDHEKQTLIAEEEKKEALNKNVSSRNKLLECQNEIEKLEREIVAIKSKVIPSNLKPLRPLRSTSSYPNAPVQKINPSKSISKQLKYKSLTHIIKFDEVGIPSSKGQRFTDRNILGKNNLNSKITAMKIYLDKNENLIAGIQCTYGSKRGGEYVKKDKEGREKQYIEEELVCKEKQFVRTISGTLNINDSLESLTVTTSDGTTRKFGVAKTFQKRFEFSIENNEYPVCVFGSLQISKQIGKKQGSIIEHLGFQINGEASQPHALVNEFNQ